MVKKPYFRIYLMLFSTFFYAVPVRAEIAGGVRGIVYDKDFDTPLVEAEVTILETGQKVKTTDEGNFVFEDVKPGTYTLVFSKEAYLRYEKQIVVSSGMLTEGEAWLSGEFTEMEEFEVKDVQIGTGTEELLLDLRMDSPALMGSVSSELMSRAGAGDAAAALNLVSGATVQDGKYAVIRGLPDRYVNSQVNGVRLPSADADKRAVQLDQFPSSIIESIQVSKTFTPDQQGDASGGAVNLILKGIPSERVLRLESGMSFNSQAAGNKDFLVYSGGGLNYFGRKDIARPVVTSDDPVNVSTTNAPLDHKYSFTYGDKFQLTDDIRVGGLFSYFYERDSSFYDDGIDDRYWIQSPDEPYTAQYSKGGFSANDSDWDPQNPAGMAMNEDYFTTSLFDVTEASQQVQWGTLGSFGLETENHSLSFMHMFTQTTDDKVRLAEDTRGKQAYFGSLYDYTNLDDPGNEHTVGINIAPYLRTMTLSYTERTTETMQFGGKHNLTFLPELSIGNLFNFQTPEFDWKLSTSSASFEQDKRMFNSRWTPDYFVPGVPGGRYTDPIPEHIEGGEFKQLVDGANINFGNFFRVFRDITEDSDQYAFNLKMPFEQWSGDTGYLKMGVFNDSLKRNYDQDSFGNSQHGQIAYKGAWQDYFSKEYFTQDFMTNDQAKLNPLDIDMDYTGTQDISALYWMADMPINSYFNVIGGYRFEDTKLGIETSPEEGVEWIVLRDELGRFSNSNQIEKANVDFSQRDMLPSIGFAFEPFEDFKIRGTYAETVARQTFKELSAAPQQEYLGGDVFIGNPELKMSALKNYDLRFDYSPYEGGLFSASYFYKDIKDPIEYVQGITDFSFTTPINYPKGKVSGLEFEVRQKLGHLWKGLEGVTLGGNATLIDSEVTLPKEEIALFKDIGFPASKRAMMNAPEHLYNIFMTYDIEDTGTQLGLFYTIRGDTLIAGAGQSNGNYIPDVYETEFGTLNFSLSQKLGDTWKLKFQVKNLLNPDIESVYRDSTRGDQIRTSYRKGTEFSIGLGAKF